MLSSSAVIAELERALTWAGDREIAGFLFEDSSGCQLIRLAPNLLDEPCAVETPGWWLDRMLRRVDPSGFRPIAWFHSHLTTLDLSEADRVAMHDFPLPWIVLLLTHGRLTWASYRSSGTRVELPSCRANEPAPDPSL